jgi:hypothetical protein
MLFYKTSLIRWTKFCLYINLEIKKWNRLVSFLPFLVDYMDHYIYIFHNHPFFDIHMHMFSVSDISLVRMLYQHYQEGWEDSLPEHLKIPIIINLKIFSCRLLTFNGINAYESNNN